MTLSYDLSFEKRELVLLAVLSVGIGSLLAVGGFLAGRISSIPASAVATTPSIGGSAFPAAAPAVTVAKPSATLDEVNGAAPAVSVPAAASPLAAAASLDAPAEASQPMYTLQFGAFHERANAEALAKDLDSMKVKAQVSVKKNNLGEAFWVVRSGSYDSTSEATDAARRTANTVGKPVLVRPAERL